MIMKNHLLLFLATLLPMMASADDSGTCGTNLTWTYVEATHTLTISGEGSMKDYSYDRSSPWKSYREEITKAIIENGVTSIGNYAFEECSGLTSITIPNSVTSIGDFAFWNCCRLTSITIPNSVTTIGEFAFENCSDLTSITIPNSVTSIGESTFNNCSGLTSITIPNSVTDIAWSAFQNCYFSIESFINNTNLSSSDCDYWGATIVDQEKPDGVLIKDNAVVFCRVWATSVTIPNCVTSIGDRAFYGCSGLTSITIPSSVTSIGYSAFEGCDGLRSITYNCKQIENWFSNEVKQNITEIFIGDNVTSIGSSTFSGCSSLTSVHISDLSAWCSISFSGFDSNPLNYAHHLYMDGQEVTNLVIPNNVTSIGAYTFYGCSGLTSITIPNSVTTIGTSAFSSCSNLNTIHISDLAWWCNTDFSNSGILDNAHHLYLSNQEITSLAIPDGITTISSYPFRNCAYLTSITIPNSVTSIAGSAFSGCSGLTSITIPNSVTSIGNSAFNGCSGITSINIPNSVTSIGGSAFRNCSGLSSIMIGNSVTSIGNYAFYGCDNLLTVNSEITEPYNSTNIFSTNTLRKGTLYVPAGTKDLYARFDGWRESS